MPRIVERRLASEADKKGLTGDRRGAYVYGTLTKVKKEAKAKRARKKR